jgi:hypothetical protein
MASQQLEQTRCRSSWDAQPGGDISDVITPLCNSKKGANSTRRDNPAWYVKRR